MRLQRGCGNVDAIANRVYRKYPRTGSLKKKRFLIYYRRDEAK
ncbi:hypothetical protein [Nostoc sp.]